MNPALMMLLRGPAASGGGTLACDFVGTTQFGSGSTITLSSLGIGDAASDRTVVIVGLARGVAGASSVSATLGGTSLTIDAARYYTGTGNVLWVGSVAYPSGTAADLVITYDTSQLRGGVGVYRVTGGTVGLLDSADGEGVTGASLSLGSVDGGFVVAGSFTVHNASDIITWTGVTEDFDNQVATAVSSISGGHAATTSAAGVTVQADASAGSQTTVIAAAFQPT